MRGGHNSDFDDFFKKMAANLLNLLSNFYNFMSNTKNSKIFKVKGVKNDLFSFFKKKSQLGSE